jgi:TolA-binding protein
MMAGRWEEAVGVIEEVENPLLRYFYQLGVCNKILKKWDHSIEEFREATRFDLDEKSMRRLSFLKIGEALMEKGNYKAAIDTFAVITRKFQTNLDADYPRYPSYCDDEKQKVHNIADDAQYLIGECFFKLGEKEKALKEFAKVGRLYPHLQKAKDAEQILTEEFLK